MRSCTLTGRFGTRYESLMAKSSESAAFDLIAWQPLERLRVPAPQLPQARRLVRRVFDRPPPLSPQPGGDDAAALARVLGNTVGSTVGGGPARRVQGPYVISGGWWAGGQQREYYFAESGRGELLWVYHDRRRERWYQQGRVE